MYIVLTRRALKKTKLSSILALANSPPGTLTGYLSPCKNETGFTLKDENYQENENKAVHTSQVLSLPESLDEIDQTKNKTTCKKGTFTLKVNQEPVP